MRSSACLVDGIILLCLVFTGVVAKKESAWSAIPLPDNLGSIPAVGLGTGYVSDEDDKDQCAEEMAEAGAKIEQQISNLPSSLQEYASRHAPRSNCDKQEKYFRRALDAGLRLFDTAFLYGTEGRIGAALKGWLDSNKGKREDVFLITKLPQTNLLCDAAIPKEIRPGLPERDDTNIRGSMECLKDVSSLGHALDISLQRLQVEYVDALLVHNPHAETQASLAEQWKVVEAAVLSGKARMGGLFVGDGPPLWLTTSDAPGGISRLSPIFAESTVKPRIVMTDGSRGRLPWMVPGVSSGWMVLDQMRRAPFAFLRRQLARVLSHLGLQQFESTVDVKAFWKELGIVAIGGGLGLNKDDWSSPGPLGNDPEAVLAEADALAKVRRSKGEKATARQLLMRFMFQTGHLGSGPIVPETSTINHLKENLGAMKLLPLQDHEINRILESAGLSPGWHGAE